jgi:hypothetical protein
VEPFDGNEHVNIEEENEERGVCHWGELGVGGKIGDIPIAAVFNLNKVPICIIISEIVWRPSPPSWTCNISDLLQHTSSIRCRVLHISQVAFNPFAPRAGAWIEW